MSIDSFGISTIMKKDLITDNQNELILLINDQFVRMIKDEVSLIIVRYQKKQEIYKFVSQEWQEVALKMVVKMKKKSKKKQGIEAQINSIIDIKEETKTKIIKDFIQMQHFKFEQEFYAWRLHH